MRKDVSVADAFVIYHNPRCSKSRAVLELLRGAGHEPEIIEYLKNPPSRERIVELLALLGLGARGIMRVKEPRYRELELAAAGVSEDALIDAMAAEPVLIERPIVVRGDRARLCRPPETVEELIRPV